VGQNAMSKFKSTNVFADLFCSHLICYINNYVHFEGASPKSLCHLDTQNTTAVVFTQ
jgi:hypothetical protein